MVRKLNYCILSLCMMLTASCSTDTDVVDEVLIYSNSAAAELKEKLDDMLLKSGYSTFEGSWSYYEKALAGNLTVTKDSFEFILPESLIADIILDSDIQSPDETFFTTSQDSWVYMEARQKVAYSVTGISDATGYMNFSNGNNYFIEHPESSMNATLPSNGDYSYSITAGEVPYRIDVHFGMGYAMYDVLIGKWTLQFPLEYITVNNLKTGWNQTHGYDYGMVLKYVTTKKIG